MYNFHNGIGTEPAALGIVFIGGLVASEQKTGLSSITLIKQKFFRAETLALSLSDYLTIFQVSYYNPQ